MNWGQAHSRKGRRHRNRSAGYPQPALSEATRALPDAPTEVHHQPPRPNMDRPAQGELFLPANPI